VNVRILVRHDLRTAAIEIVDDVCDGALVPRDGARGDDHDIAFSISICLCSPIDIRESAEEGSPCVPVVMITRWRASRSGELARASRGNRM